MKERTKTLILEAGLSFGLCAITFGTGWLVSNLDPDHAMLYMFWAGMAYMFGLCKIPPGSEFNRKTRENHMAS